jgi:hypothetical protein
MGTCSSSDEEFLNEYKARFSQVNQKPEVAGKGAIDFSPDAIDRELIDFALDGPEYYNNPNVGVFNASARTELPNKKEENKKQPK